jgi:hypothetical protein
MFLISMLKLIRFVVARDWEMTWTYHMSQIVSPKVIYSLLVLSIVYANANTCSSHVNLTWQLGQSRHHALECEFSNFSTCTIFLLQHIWRQHAQPCGLMQPDKRPAHCTCLSLNCITHHHPARLTRKHTFILSHFHCAVCFGSLGLLTTYFDSDKSTLSSYVVPRDKHCLYDF